MECKDPTIDADYSSVLEILLMEIRGVTIFYSTFKKRERDKIEKKNLVNDI